MQIHFHISRNFNSPKQVSSLYLVSKFSRNRILTANYVLYRRVCYGTSQTEQHTSSALRCITNRATYKQCGTVHHKQSNIQTLRYGASQTEQHTSSALRCITNRATYKQCGTVHHKQGNVQTVRYGASQTGQRTNSAVWCITNRATYKQICLLNQINRLRA